MPRFPRKRLFIFAAVLPVVAAGLVAGTQVAASAAANPGPGFPARFAAPYAEMWNNPSTLTAAANATGNKYFTLAFVISQGTCNATIDGDTPITDSGWNNAINSLRASGGDVIVSFGGASGSELTSCSTVASMQAQYKKVIDQFNLTRIDLDIEGSTISDTAANDRRNTALANLQTQYAAAGKTLAVDYTLATDPGGMGGDQLSLLNNAKSHNLNVNVVNIMTMDYYQGPMDMGQAAISAANGLHAQLGQIWNTKTSAQLWAMEGNTPLVGVNDDGDTTFTTQDATELESFAAANGISRLSFWALGIDQSTGYQYTNIFKKIASGGTTPPTGGGGAIHGVGGKCVDVAAASSANGTAVQLYTCNGTAAQSWAHTGNTFQSLGKCLDVAAAGTANGALVQIYDCNGTAAQAWTTGANNRLVNTGSGKCLDASNNSSADGTRLQIWTCTGSANQSWTLS